MGRYFDHFLLPHQFARANFSNELAVLVVMKLDRTTILVHFQAADVDRATQADIHVLISPDISCLTTVQRTGLDFALDLDY